MVVKCCECSFYGTGIVWRFESIIFEKGPGIHSHRYSYRHTHTGDTIAYIYDYLTILNSHLAGFKY